jgi:predicted amidohydrolase
VLIGSVQQNTLWNDTGKNHVNILSLVEKLDSRCDIIVLTEMFNTGFSFPLGNDATIAAQRGLLTLLEISSLRKDALVFGSCPEVLNGKVFNTAIGVLNSAVVFRYQKMHLFSYSEEATLYSRGEALIDFNFRNCLIRPLICYDLRFPGSFTSLAKEVFPEVYIIVANWPTPRKGHFEILLRARAIEQQAYVIGVNRVGSEPIKNGVSLTYSGESRMFGPEGEEIFNMGEEEGVMTGSIDLPKLREYRARFPALLDRLS